MTCSLDWLLVFCVILKPWKGVLEVMTAWKWRHTKKMMGVLTVLIVMIRFRYQRSL